MMGPSRATVSSLMALAAGLCLAGPAVAQRAQADFTITAELRSRRLRETSGVAVSRQHPGILWTHNDSGDDPVLYATDLQGHNLGEYRVHGARARDWEDIALGLCPETDDDCLFIGDIGDNAERRASVSIYILPEPPPPPAGPIQAVSARRLVVHYADRPKDAEALAVDAQGTILVISKGRSGPVTLYRISRDDARGSEVTVEPSDELGIAPANMPSTITAASISPDGTLLVVRSYVEIIFYRWAGGHAERMNPSCWLGLREPQGEAVDFLDASTLVLTSEAQFGRPALISTVRCQESLPSP
jgi:hypothetical protein